MRTGLQNYLIEVLGLTKIVRPSSAVQADTKSAEASNKWLFVIPTSENAAVEKLAHKIASATKKQVKVVRGEAFRQETFANVIIFGENNFSSLGFNSKAFFDSFYQPTTENSKNIWCSHDLIDMLDGPENQVRNLKRQVWAQLKKVMQL